MSNTKKKHLLLFCLAIVFSVISSLSLLAASMVNSEGKHKEVLITFALLFWIGLALEQVFFWSANHIMKVAVARANHGICGRSGVRALPAFTEGFVADAVFIVSLLSMIVCIALGLGESVMQYVFICLMVLSFRLRCFLNGKNYKYIKIGKRKVDKKHG